MPSWNKVAILGVGLIGGSIGLGLRHRHLAQRVVGHGTNLDELRVAQERGAVDETTPSLKVAVADCDLAVVCTPVASVSQLVERALPHLPKRAVITDVASTKLSIVQAIEQLAETPVPFVGGHPLAGSEQSGPTAANEALFAGRQVILTPTQRTSPEALAEVSKLWEGLGALVTSLSPEEHDRIVAGTSHLPHLLASLLAGKTTDDERKFAATGWADTTRIAAGDPQLWQEILLDNRVALLQQIDEFQALLFRTRQALQNQDLDELTRMLQQGKQNRDALGS